MQSNKQNPSPLTHLAFGILALILLTVYPAHAEEELGKPILVIGASIENGTTPLDDNLSGPWGGYAVNAGSYLSLGDALIRTKKLNGFVINEAQGGATTFYRLRCGMDQCLSVGWQGYDNQFQKALARVPILSHDSPPQVTGYNADYILIGNPNDCLHSGAMGIPQSQTTPCTESDMNDVIDRLEAIAEQAISLGITPIFNIMPKYSDRDMPAFQQAYGLYWVISEEDANTYRDLHRTRLEAEVPEALVVDAWKGFEPLSDGIHPTPKTAMRAAKRIAKAIKHHQKAHQQ